MSPSSFLTHIRAPRTVRLRRAGTAAGGVILVAAALSACGGSNAPPFVAAATVAAATPAATTAAPAVVTAQRVALSEWKVDVPATMRAGQVTFDVTNAGAAVHELLVFRSTLTPAQYPRESSGAIAEDGAGITKVSDGDNLDPGKSQSRTVDLTVPGTYLFVCNLPAHFQQGMFTVVTVT
jgi:uncharacterized cupredoxin-like copper-binding protein